MKSYRQLLAARHPTNKLALGLSVAMVAVIGVVLLLSSRAATSSQLYLKPASGTYPPGSNVSVELRTNSGTTAVNAVEAYLEYKPDQLQFVSVQEEGGVFNLSTPSSGAANGVVTVSRGRVGGITGDQKVVTVVFKALKEGTATVAIRSNSVLLRQSDSRNIVSSVSGASFTIGGGSTTPPPPQTGSGQLLIDPAAGSFGTGTNMTVAVRMDSGSTEVNATRVRLQYPADKLTYARVDYAGSPFTVGPEVSVSNGVVEINRGSTAGVTGSKLVANVTFSVKAAGSAPLSFASGSVLLRRSDSSNIASVFTGGTYTLTAASAPPANPQPPVSGNPGRLYLDPPSGNGVVGSSLSVQVRMDSGTEEVNAAGIRLQYPADKLNYSGTSFSGSPFGIGPNVTAQDGVVEINRATIGSVKGDQSVALVTFQVKEAGTAALSFGSGSVILRRSDSKNIAGTYTGGNFTLAAAGAGQPVVGTPISGPPGGGGIIDTIVDAISGPLDLFGPDDPAGYDDSIAGQPGSGSLPHVGTSASPAGNAALAILTILVVLGLLAGAGGLYLHRRSSLVRAAGATGATSPIPQSIQSVSGSRTGAPSAPSSQGLVYPTVKREDDI